MSFSKHLKQKTSVQACREPSKKVYREQQKQTRIAQMNNEFLLFLLELKKDQKHEVMEFRLHFHKKYLKYRENNCTNIEADLKELIKNYKKLNKHICI